MSFILNIETTTNVCSVSLSENGKLIGIKESDEKNNHSATLTIFITEVFKKNKISAKELAAVAISEGPGSYTGLRIGTSVAKGICYANNIPLISVDTLQALAFGTKTDIIDNNLLLCPMIDARRMEVYFSFFDNKINKITQTDSIELKEETFKDKLKNQKIIFSGNGANKFKEIINSDNAIFIDNILTSAKNMVELSYNKYINKKFVDVAYFTPFYLKNFIAIKSKKNLLGIWKNQ